MKAVELSVPWREILYNMGLQNLKDYKVTKVKLDKLGIYFKITITSEKADWPELKKGEKPLYATIKKKTISDIKIFDPNINMVLNKLNTFPPYGWTGKENESS